MPIPNLDSTDITALRGVRYLRDLYTPASGSAPAVALSHYNRATKSQFIADTDLQDIANDVARAYGEELSGVYQDSYGVAIGRGKSTVDADIDATKIQLDAFYRLIRAAVFEMMMLDSGYSGSIADEEQRKAIYKAWGVQILKDRQFTRVRTSAPFLSLPIERY